MFTGLLHFEIFLLLGILLFVCITFFRSLRPETIINTALLFSIGVIAMSAANWNQSGSMFSETFEVNRFTQWIKIILSLGFFIVTVLSRHILGYRRDEFGEAYLFLTASFLGLSLVISATNLLVFYVALELSSYSLYLLVPLRRKGLAEEAALKYFFLGITSSALMLFGMSFLYGATGSLQIPEVFLQVQATPSNPLLFLGFLLALVGIFFKLAIIPFQFWAPDTYQETPAPVASFIATISKVGILAVFLIWGAWLGKAWLPFTTLLVVLSLLTMTWGNFAALRQREAKRMLAYSGIGQVGYLLLGLLAWTQTGFGIVIFYSVLYMVMSLGAFFVISLLSRPGNDPQIEDFNGLAKRSPLLGLTLLLSLFSLAGVPPLAGFTGKWILFKTAFDAGYGFLTFWAIANSVLSLYYYITFVKAAYLKEPNNDQMPIRLSMVDKSLGLLFIVSILLFGLYPTPLLKLAHSAISALF